MSVPRAEVLAIGDELLHGGSIDTNSAWIAARLGSLGIRSQRVTVLSDEPGELEAGLADACARAEVVITTGGLGPTEDDRTRHALAAVAGVALRFDDGAWRSICDYLAGRGRPPSDDNRRQALVPDGGLAIDNLHGTAPAIRLGVGRCTVFALPGVPLEMKALLDEQVLPQLAAEFGPRLRPIAQRVLNVLGPTEAALGARLADVMSDLSGDLRVGITAHFGLLRVRILASGPDPRTAGERAEQMAERLRPRLGDELIFEGDQPLAVRLIADLRARGLRLATAESCTGGMVGAAITAVPGSSAVYAGGLVAYSNDVKRGELGVPAGLLDSRGAVSEEVAGAMCAGARRRFGTELAVAVTGTAGPDGGSADKPVGTVCFGIADAAGEHTWRQRFPAFGRDFIRERSTFEALAGLVSRLAGR